MCKGCSTSPTIKQMPVKVTMEYYFSLAFGKNPNIWQHVLQNLWENLYTMLIENQISTTPMERNLIISSKSTYSFISWFSNIISLNASQIYTVKNMKKWFIPPLFVIVNWEQSERALIDWLNQGSSHTVGY